MGKQGQVGTAGLCAWGRGSGTAKGWAEVSAYRGKLNRMTSLSFLILLKQGLVPGLPPLSPARLWGYSVPSTVKTATAFQTVQRHSQLSLLRTLHNCEERPMHHRCGHFTSTPESLNQAGPQHEAGETIFTSEQVTPREVKGSAQGRKGSCM